MPARAHADPVAVGERALLGLAGRVLLHRDERRRPDPLLVGAAHEVARTLRRDHRHVDAGGRHDRAEVDREPVGEHQHVAVLEVRRDVLRVDLPVRGVGQQAHHHVGLGHRVGGVEHAQARLLGLGAAGRARPEPDPHVEPAVLQVLGVRVALRAEAEDRDLLIAQDAGVGVLLVVDRGHRASVPSGRAIARAQASFATLSVRSLMPRSPRPSAIRPVRRQLDDAEVAQQRRAAPRASRACPAASSVSVALRHVDDVHAEHVGDLHDARRGCRPRSAPSPASARARRPSRGRARGS